jgi:hypothetical protein
MTIDGFVKSRETPFTVIPANPGSGPGQAPESSVSKLLWIFWTPVPLSPRKPGTGVTIFCEFITIAKC